MRKKMVLLQRQQRDCILQKELLDEIEAKGVELVYLTLHVGLGTFRPVSVDKIEEHHMHSEFYRLTEEAAERLNQVRKNGGKIVAVGTTSIRTLETIGTKFNGEIKADSGWTDIFITPGMNSKWWKLSQPISICQNRL